ncbi:hypothetical protein EDC01DRAFT_782553 [Geopyxis carbonaria]|nr:hypothetical protein EDC01DRAFT_782553 [Geopyxis carbonaria]
MTTTDKKETVLSPTLDASAAPIASSADAPVAANLHPKADETRDETPAPALADAYAGSEMLVDDVPSLGVAKGVKAEAAKGKNKGKGKAKEATGGFKEADDNVMDEQEGWWKAGS